MLSIEDLGGYSVMTEAEVAKQLIINLNQCDLWVQKDILKRCSDWIQSGGNLDDPYIMRQLQFTSRYIEVELAKNKVNN